MIEFQLSLDSKEANGIFFKFDYSRVFIKFLEEGSAVLEKKTTNIAKNIKIFEGSKLGQSATGAVDVFLPLMQTRHQNTIM
jgi:hypothetical protein